MNDLLFQNAVRAHQAGKLAEAANLYAEILRGDPRHFPALVSLGYLNWQAGHFEDAERLLGEALRINASSAEAQFLRGSALQQLNRAAEALACFDGALALKPNFPEAQSGRAAALKSLGRDSAPFPAPSSASTVPESAATAYVRACTLAQANQLEQALTEFDHAIAIAPHFLEALCNRGAVLLALKRHDEALQSLDAALRVNPSFFEALNNRGNALCELGRFEEAVACYDRALTARPNAFEVLLNRGNALVSAHRADEAITSYEQALASQPGNAGALKGRANALFELGRFEEAIGGFEAVLARDPAQPYALGDLVFSKLQCCDWRNLTEERARILAAVKSGYPVINPFEFLALPSGADEQRSCAAIWANEKFPPAEPLWRGEAYRHERLRIAYLSANFHNHAVGQAIVGVLEKHDRARFEIVGISWGPDDGSALRARVVRACDRFIDVSGKSDQDVAKLLRDSEIDIVVDLMGFTADHRTRILASRAAPIQVNYLGYAGTMAAPYVDYSIADSVVIPDEERLFYSEQVVALPGSYLPVDDTRVAGQAIARSAAGLPDDAFVFACFNNSYKFSPEMFAVWMRLLQRTERSVLWLSRVNAAAARNLAREANDRGVDPSRLIFAPFVANPADHLARLALADLFIDTLPYNAHATAIDALLAGLPVLTCKGQSFAGRVGASLLHAAGLPELVMSSLDAYEALALELANDRAKLAALKAKLTGNRHSQPLFDTARYTRSLEQAYLDMQKRLGSGSIS